MISTSSTADPKNTPVGLILFALAVGGLAIGTGEFAVMSLLPTFAADLHIDAPTAGHVISAYALGVVVGAPVIAVLSARMPRRDLLLALMGVFAAGNFASALAPNYETLVLFRFLSGLPHGAYFGVASLMAAALAGPAKRAQAVGRLMLGLTVATVVGVPLTTWLGQMAGWRWGFALVGLLGLVTFAFVGLTAPRGKPDATASPLRELGALRRSQVWLALGTGAIGFGGLFAVYTYISPTLTDVTGVTPSVVPLVLFVFGLGMVSGNLAGAWAADRALKAAIVGILLWSAVALLLFTVAAPSLWTVVPVMFLIGCGVALGPALQTRLMDVAGDAQTLAAALHHSAFNVANALGPWLGGLAIAAGMGWTATGWVGALLALGGLAIFGTSLLLERRSEPNPEPGLEPEPAPLGE